MIWSDDREAVQAFPSGVFTRAARSARESGCHRDPEPEPFLTQPRNIVVGHTVVLMPMLVGSLLPTLMAVLFSRLRRAAEPSPPHRGF